MDGFVAFEIGCGGAELQGEEIAVWGKRRLANVFEIDDAGTDLDEVHRGCPECVATVPFCREK